jgi:hypothetical protein
MADKLLEESRVNPADLPAPTAADDPVRRFREELNQLRNSAGVPSYRQLAARAHYSRSALWRASRGSRLPSREITLALACACGGDKDEWDRKWCAARAQSLIAPLATDAPDPAVPPAAAALLPVPTARRRRGPSGGTVVFLAAAAVVALAIAILRLVAAPSAAPLRPDASFIGPSDGDDPYVSKCATDEQRLQFQNLYWPDHQLYGWLELYHSNLCNASWGYIFGPNSPRWRVTIIARRLPDNTIAPSSIQEVAPANSWGNVLITNAGSCVRVEAYITVGMKRGPAAVTSCRPDQQHTSIGPPPTPPPAPPARYADGAPPGPSGARAPLQLPPSAPGQSATAGAWLLAGLMQRHQGRGTRSVHGHGRPAQVKLMRDAVGSVAERASGHGVSSHRVRAGVGTAWRRNGPPAPHRPDPGLPATPSTTAPAR